SVHRDAYNCDITYGTNNEFGFDYLRDNMAWSADELVQRGHSFAIVDEVDSILIDEARTPLIISGPAEQSARWYQEFARVVFRLYDKLSGMTGTAKTEEGELNKVYKVGVITIPTHRDMIRLDHPDVIYKTEKAKYNAVVEDIVERNSMGQPILVGTVSVEKSELLSQLLRRRGVAHAVLNAKFHAKEAEIIAQAGRKGAVTVATNMAGRGTDI